MSSVIKLSSPDTDEFWEIPVVYEDDVLLAVDKPSRLLTSPDRYDPNRPNLMKLLHRDIERGAHWASSRKLTYLMNVHRLDFETSGVILLCKTKAVLTTLTDQFGTDKPVKFYVAILHGNPSETEFEVDAKLGPHPTKIGLMRVDPKNGKKSKTVFRVMERFASFSVVRCQPITGRTHQIRVHLRHAGFSIVGDSLYGGENLYLSQLKRRYKSKEGDEKPLLGRVALHAEELQVPHPLSGELIRMVASMPRDMEVALKYLRKFAAVRD